MVGRRLMVLNVLGIDGTPAYIAEVYLSSMKRVLGIMLKHAPRMASVKL